MTTTVSTDQAFGLTEEQRDLVAALRDFCRRECGTRELRDAPTDGGRDAHSDALYAKLAEAGYLGISIPEEHGGAGGELSFAGPHSPSRVALRPRHGGLRPPLTACLRGRVDASRGSGGETAPPPDGSGDVPVSSRTRSSPVSNGKESSTPRIRPGAARRAGEQQDPQQYCPETSHARHPEVVTGSRHPRGRPRGVHPAAASERDAPGPLGQG